MSILTNVRVTDPDTSHDAAEQANRNAALIRSRVLEIVRERGTTGVTGEEANSLYALRFEGAKWDTARKRLSDLLADELIIDSGRRRNGARVLVDAQLAEVAA